MDVPKLAPEDVSPLLRDLCVRLGFCLPPEDRAALCASPPGDVDSFTEAVFRAERLDASPHEELWRQVRETVARTFEVSGGAIPRPPFADGWTDAPRCPARRTR